MADILGYEVVACARDECIAEIVEVLREKSGRGCKWLACLNPHSYSNALQDARFSSALKQSDWLVPDGIGIVIAGSLLGQRLRERITGMDIYLGIMAELDAQGGRVFFLGSTNETLSKIKAKVAYDYPNIHVVGTYSPPFKPEFTNDDCAVMHKSVSDAAPDVLWVGMTAPKQEKWISENVQQLECKFACAIGAVFDFYVGQVKRSHPLFQKLGLEWLPRLIRQPRRLWRRTFVSAPVFLWHVFLQRFGVLDKH